MIVGVTPDLVGLELPTVVTFQGCCYVWVGGSSFDYLSGIVASQTDWLELTS